MKTLVSPCFAALRLEQKTIFLPSGEKLMGDYKFCQRRRFKYVPKPAKPYDDERVKYKLSDPNKFSGKHVVIVGAGNSAVEAAIDLAAYRSEEGTELIGWRDNAVSLVIRSNFKSDLKLGNKMMVYDHMDAGRVKAFFGQIIKEITHDEVVLMSARERDPKTAKETARIKNDYVFALIGGEKPTNRLYVSSPMQPPESVALTVNLDVAACCGLPLIEPVAGSSINPAGSAPAIREKVKGPVPTA